MANDDLDHDTDSLLTAYALGELGETERADIATRLAESAEDRRLVEETQRLGGLLRQVVAAPEGAPSSGLRATVLQRLAEPAPAEMPHPRPRFPRRRYWLPLSLAASLLVICGTVYTLLSTKHQERLVAKNDFVVSAPNDPADDVVLEPMIVDFAESSVEAAPESMTADLKGVVIQEEESPLELPSRVDADYDQVRRPRGSSIVKSGGDSTADRDLDERSLRGELLTGGKGLPDDDEGDGTVQGQIASKQEPTIEFRGRKESERRMLLGRYGGMAGGMGAMGVDGASLMQGGRALSSAGGNRNHVFGADFEAYAPIAENPFLSVTEHPLSTFSIDVDTASYANVRRFLNSHALPPPAAVRIEELVNYFQYDYPQPEGPTPFSVTTDVARCPWNAEHQLLRVGLKGREVPADHRPPSNLVFLLDVSGSMDAPNKLPLVKEAMQLLTDKLTENDRVAIVVYAGNSGLVLPSTNGDNKQAIREAIAGLVASGSTNGGQGLQMAYEVARTGFLKEGTNRVILATDGDFNVGVTGQDDLVRLIEAEAKSGVFLSALGFGVGNLKDATLEKLADKGNGNYAYIDTLSEARKVLVEQLSGTLVTIAKDVKVQIEFNPAQVGEFRLIGYEDRILAHQDFNDDRKDSGDIGAGHTVTALYELSPSGAVAGVGPLKYQRSQPLAPAAESGELATIKLRYKEPDADESRLIEHVVAGGPRQNIAKPGDFQFAAAVAAFGMLLRDSAYRGEATYEMVLELAQPGLADDANGYRSEFVRLVRQAQEIGRRESSKQK
ncbi:MAG TPA: von Willebrand factor type A domain-containing protein [Pirellulales bacterium]|nr:von Willebrand factor type A domain-containing protein [Pirellulales bacterium]